MKAPGGFEPFNSFYSTQKSTNRSGLAERKIFSTDQRLRKVQKIGGFVINKEGIIMKNQESNPNKKLVEREKARENLSKMSKLPDLSISDNNDVTASSRYRGTSEYMNYAPLTDKVRIYKGKKTQIVDILVMNPGSGLDDYKTQTN